MKNGMYKKISNAHRLGPGGINCACCGPAPGSERKKWMKVGKAKVRKFFKMEIENQMKENSKL